MKLIPRTAFSIAASLGMVFFGSISRANSSDQDSSLVQGDSLGSWGVNVHTNFNGKGLTSIGAQWVRVTLRWEDIEKGATGRYDWSATDKVLSHYLDDNHMHVIGILALDRLNPLYAGAVADKPRVFNAIAEWMGATAGHFKERGIVWEIGNEPEAFPMEGYWNDPVTYTHMARASAQAIKGADPSGKTAALSLAWMDRPYAVAALAAGLLNDGTIDYLSFHGYHRETIAPESGLAEDVAWLRSKASSATPVGMRVPIVIDTETGYALAPFESPKDIHNWRIIVYSEEAQAAYLARHFIEEISLEIPISIWYKDMYGESGFSLYYADSSSPLGLRPMGRAFRTLASLLPQDPASLRNYRYQVSIKRKSTTALPPEDIAGGPQLFVRSFLRERTDGQHAIIIAVWNSVEAFEGKILVSRTLTATQCLERWRTVSSADPVNLRSTLTIRNLPEGSIQSIQALSLPDGDPVQTTEAAGSTPTFNRGNTMLTVTARPMPTIFVVNLKTE